MDNCVKGFITNQWDRNNLMFLLNSPDVVLNDWYNQADKDDLAYAQELLDSYKAELIMRANEIKVEASLIRSNFNEALEVIAKCK